ncbi:hypothetical protein GCK72_002829 [Caenorhabditis remanei]|uniref:C2H2-type domain-containing protein n=1 Tax=Caenorhabditis remanei TaxID=31234 RepID=A0A6A5HTV5_CAERE|nr:hypothetical protein GCK72_002825 [Caenorhabditis remanei]XP_053592279.1 hypothetical protein GCK72_002829 [Caenorhabditis remanei]KAF1771001.1 hypothetical protein GCK72_002825 [Caenorhabditis remanei]KAF1771005.1 hypothetical protein GCK72_002829 [Caenorhabditis remanei]
MAEFRKHSCEDCQRLFRRPSELERHREKVHGDSPYLFCQHENCSFKSPYYRSLARHIEQKHRCTKSESKRKGGAAQIRADERLKMNKAATMQWLDQDQDDEDSCKIGEM